MRAWGKAPIGTSTKEILRAMGKSENPHMPRFDEWTEHDDYIEYKVSYFTD